MNKESLFVYDDHTIEVYDFKHVFNETNRKDLRFQISSEEKHSRITKVLTSDESENIAIVIEQP